jgi:hypothetical protein
MRTRLHPWVAAGLVSLAASGCDLTSSSPPDETISELCTDWGKAICQVGSGACDFDVTSCAAYQTGVCQTYVGTLQGGTRQYSQANGAACIKELNDIYGGSPSTIPATSLLQQQAICARVIVGGQPVDQACMVDADCANGLVCAPAVFGGSSNVCATVMPIQLGDICGDPGDQCQGDSYCQAQGSGQAPQCVTTPAAGDGCSTSVPCGTGDVCSGDAGICVAASTSGACSTNAECASGYCDLNPPAACTDGLSFARGSDDCNGIAGVSSPDGG